MPPIYPNGLLIYHKGRLIKRYRPPLGTLLPFFSNPLLNFIGVIEVSEKFTLNMFATSFLNEDLLLQPLYERI